jgi:predicted ester cyclase
MKINPGIIKLFLITIFFGACTSNQNNSVLERNKEIVLIMNHEVWNKGNLVAIDELFSANFVLHFLPDSSELKGIEALRENVREHREAFPDWKENIKHIVAEDDLVVIHFQSSGTNLGSWLGNPPTGRKVLINEFAILRVEDRKIAEQWLLPDIFNLTKQLGYNNR